MPVVQALKDLIGDGAWAADTPDERQTPEDAGLTRAMGWPVSYEQRGSGKHPERRVFNQLHWEITSAILDIAHCGVPPHSLEVDYVPTDDAECFVTTTSGLWRTRTATGPSYDNAVSPDTEGQTIWRRY